MVRILARALPLIKRLTPGVIWHGDRSARTVFLTFDDGPDPEVTLPLLDILDVYECPAAFFLIGARLVETPAIAREIVRRGYDVGNHGWSHRSLFHLGADAARNEFHRTSRAVSDVCGESAKWVRPPYGHITPDFLKMLQEQELRGLVGEIIPGDWPGGESEDKVVDRVMKGARGGSVICLHDGGNPRVLKIVPRVIEAVRGKGLQFAPLVSLC